MSNAVSLAPTPADRRALIAVDLGAESCRVSLLRWIALADGDAAPEIRLLHRVPNGPVRQADGTLRWPFRQLLASVEDGIRLCAREAPEGVRSIAVDGWAVDYVRLDAQGEALEEPFCYRDERTIAAVTGLNSLVSPERMRAITGIELQPINTGYQLYADCLTGIQETPWINLPEYCLHCWGAPVVAERTNASHTQLLDLNGTWSQEIFAGAGLDVSCAPHILPAGSIVGKLRGALASTPGLEKIDLIAPACHDTASAIAGIAEVDDDWAYISCGTWSLVGTVIRSPLNSNSVQQDNFTNLCGVGDTLLFHKSVNGLWLLKQCMDQWARDGEPWQLSELLEAAATETPPQSVLDVDEPSLLRVGNMPDRVRAQLRERKLGEISTQSVDAPAMVSLLLYSLADRYAQVLARLQVHTGKRFRRVVMVGGGAQNGMLRRLTQDRTGLPVVIGPTESATAGNFAVQLAALETALPAESSAFVDVVSAWARKLA